MEKYTMWHGGAQSIKRADLSPLAGAVVVIWPDNDEPGMQAADYIAEKLKSSASEIRRVVPEPDWPAKYDIADDPDPARVIANARTIWPIEQVATIPEPNSQLTARLVLHGLRTSLSKTSL